MKRQIIKIDENKCNGCGICATACAEGAIQMIDGKAWLVSEIFCDGLGACIGECPVGAISIEEREAVPYNERETMKRLLPQGMNVVQAHLKHLKSHGQTKLFEEGIAVLRERNFPVPDFDSVLPDAAPDTSPAHAATLSMASPSQPAACGCPSKLDMFNPNRQMNWPIQLHLVNPDSAVFDNADLVIAADCTAFSVPDFQKNYTQGKVLIIFCPKLDQATEVYIEKLTNIFANHDLRSIEILRMTVPCCGGTTMIVRQALQLSGKQIPVEEKILNLP